MSRLCLCLLSLLFAVHAHAADAPSIQRVFIVGDSTASEYPPARYPRTGWGQMLDGYFDADIEVFNRAVSGRSTRSYVVERHFDKIMAELRSGDLLLIQFGHNDAKQDDPSRYADPEVDFPAGLNRFVTTARARGAIPVLITPVARRLFDAAGQAVDTHGQYAIAVRQQAKAGIVPLIDLGQRSLDWIDALGPEVSKAYFLHDPQRGLIDDTHFHRRGANAVACMVAGDLVALKLIEAAHLSRDVDCGMPPGRRQRLAAQSLPSAIQHAETIEMTQPGPHGGDGLTVSASFFADAPKLGLVVRRRTLHQGASIGLHEHGKDEVYYVLSGQGEFTLDGVAHSVIAGHAMLTRDASSHSLRQIGTEPLQILIVYGNDRE